MTRLQLLDRLFIINRGFKNLGVIQRRVVIRYTTLGLAYLFPHIIKGRFSVRNVLNQIRLAKELKNSRYIDKGE